MVPPAQNLNLDIAAISGICGSISIACWIVVFSPQIIENWKRGSADGLSLQFIIIWLAGDIFNIWGAVLQGVLPTMVILAVYYTIADVVLLGQCFYYKGFTWRDEVVPPAKAKPAHPSGSIGEANETTGLLSAPPNNTTTTQARRSSTVSVQHLSPAVPLLDPPRSSSQPPAVIAPTSTLQTVLFNIFSVLIVCIAGVLGWWISNRSPASSHHSHNPIPSPSVDSDPITFSRWGQIFGYLCAILYLGSRVPQLLLNYRRKSTEGISMLFFLFACIGNLTYVLSIFAYEAPCLTSTRHGGQECGSGEARLQYGRYIAVNASWLVGSAGTLLLDLGVFSQFFLYGEGNSARQEDEEAVAVS